MLRPRVSTSAGQSFVAGAGGDGNSDGEAVLPLLVGVFIDFAWDAHAEKAILEEQDRHLYGAMLASDPFFLFCSRECAWM